MRSIFLLCFSLFTIFTTFGQSLDTLYLNYSDEVENYFINASKDALELGIIEKYLKKKQTATIYFNGSEYNAKVRLKGDWTDHLSEYRWSMRVELDSGKIIGNSKFSLQHPSTRGGDREAIFHNVLHKEKILTTDYSFLDLVVNGVSWGKYAFEEHFTKDLLTRNNRVNGPIFKLNEDGFWEVQKLQITRKEESYYEYQIFQSSEIQCFQRKKIESNPTLFNQFNKGYLDLRKWQHHQPDFNRINVDKYAKYFALCDVFTMYHGLQWHNHRFYLNPENSKIEPVAYDCFSKDNQLIGKNILGIFNEHYQTVYFPEQWFNYVLFTNENFKIKYWRYLRHYGSLGYLSKLEFENIITSKLKSELLSKSKSIENIKMIDQLNPKFYSYENWKLDHPSDVKQYNDPINDSLLQNVSIVAEATDSIEITNFHYYPIQIMGFGSSSQLIDSIQFNIRHNEKVKVSLSNFDFVFAKRTDGQIRNFRIRKVPDSLTLEKEFIFLSESSSNITESSSDINSIKDYSLLITLFLCLVIFLVYKLIKQKIVWPYLVLIPILIFLFFQIILDFNGLYGQDSHAYLGFSKHLIFGSPEFVIYEWPKIFPALGACLTFLGISNLAGLQLISLFSLIGSLYFTNKIIQLLYKKDGTLFLVLGAVTQIYFVRAGMLVMTDMLAAFLVIVSFSYYFHYLQSRNYRKLILLLLFSGLAFFARYPTVVLTGIIILHALILYIKSIKLLFRVILGSVFTGLALLILSLNGDFVIRAFEILNEFNIVNLFKRSFITESGSSDYLVPNGIAIFANFFHIGYLSIGAVLIPFYKKINRKNWVFILSVLVYFIFIGGQITQNYRFFVISHLLVLIILFPTFNALNDWLKSKRLLVIFITGTIVFNLLFFVYSFRKTYDVYQDEKEVVTALKEIDSKQTIYGFYVDQSFPSYGINNDVKNFFFEEYETFEKGSLVVFNPEKFEKQWSNHAVMNNWTNLNNNYTLDTIKSLRNNWKIYQIK